MAVFVRRAPLTPPGRTLIAWDGAAHLIQPDRHDNVIARIAPVGAPDDGQPGDGPKDDGQGTETKPAAASSDVKKNTSPDAWATALATVIFIVALLVTVKYLFGNPATGPTFKATEGISAFALFYIVAQAAERLVEMVLPYVDRRTGGKIAKAAARDRKVVAASGGVAHDKADAEKEVGALAQEAADAQAEVDQARANRTALVFGWTAAIGMLLCGYLEADFLRAVGVTFSKPETVGGFDEMILMAVTGLIVGGGAKALHDTITNVSKASEKKDTPPETAGAA